MQAFAEVEIVAALAHVDADADGRLAVDAEHLRGRIAVAALNLGDVGEFVEASIDPEVEVGNALGLQERAGNVDKHVLVRRVDDAGGHNRVLPRDRRQHFVEAELEIGELLGREAEIDLLVLVAKNLDLADIGRTQELGPCRFGEVARLARREAVVGDAVDDAEDVAKLIVEEGADHAGRERRLDVTDLLADLVPDVVELALGRRLLEVDENGRLAGFGVALEVIELGSFLELLLEPVGHLCEHIGRRGPGPDRLDHHGLHGEVRILLPAEPLISADATDDADEHEEYDDGPVVVRPIPKD